MIRPNFPKQKVPLSVKKDDEKFGIPTINAILDDLTFPAAGDEIAKLYDAYNGVIRETDYNYVIDPYKGDQYRKRNFPAKIRNYNIIRSVVDTLIGEKDRRGLRYHATVKNPDVVTRKEQAERSKILEHMKQQYINEMNNAGLPTGHPSQELPDLESMIKEFKETYKDARAINAEEVLEYLKADKELRDEFILGFLDWLITGTVFSYKDVFHDDVQYEIINPLDLAYDKSPGLKYVEDGAYAARRSLLTTNEIVDRFYDKLSEDDIDDLEIGDTGVSLNLPSVPGILKQGARDEYHEVYHVVWKTLEKIGILTYPDPVTGEILQMEVSETYKPDSDIGESIEWFWVNAVWGGYKVGRNKYFDIGPIKAQRGTLDNPSICKLPYNGRCYSDRNSDNVSVVQMGLPYQLLYNIFHYRLELSVAKNKDKIMLMEMNTIPKRHGWDEETFLYFTDAMGVAFIDSTQVGKTGEKIAFNQWSVLDMSLGKYIEAQLNLLEIIKMEWEESLGINRQRKGQVMASDGKGTTDAALFQSTAITNEIFRKFDMFQQRDLQGLVDISKIAYAGGKKASYLNSDYMEAYLDVAGEDYANSEIGLFVVSSTQENIKLETLKQVALTFAQNGSKPTTVAEILDADHFQKIKAKLKEVEQTEQELESAQAQRELEASERIEQMRIEDREDQQEHEAVENQKDRDHEYLLKLMDTDSAAVAREEDRTVKGSAEASSREKLNFEREKHYNEIREKQADRLSKDLTEAGKLALKNKEIDANVAIAKENQTKAELQAKGKIGEKKK